MIYFLTVNYYASDLIAKLIKSIENQNLEDYQILVINNSPGDSYIHQYSATKIEIIEAETNLGFACGCNLGLQKIYQQDSQGIVWLINPDAYLENNCLNQALSFWQTDQQVSILGTLIHTPDHKPWFAGGKFMPHLGAIIETDLISSYPEQDYIACDWVSGCSLLINLAKFSQCPQFDSKYFLYYEDVDFCQHYQHQGHLVAITGKISITHQPSSITDRHISNKIHHSTYSYLHFLSKYTNKFTWWLRFLRVLIHAIFVLPIKPQVTRGKLSGIKSYFAVAN